MWLQVRPSEPAIRREIDESASYINNKGEHPKIGMCISPAKIVFGDSEIKDGQWKFVNADKEIIEDLEYMYKVCVDIILICS